MKADRNGTMSEQARYRIGYKSPSKVDRGCNNRCHNCHHSEVTYCHTLRCKRIGAAVARNATCDQWVRSIR